MNFKYPIRFRRTNFKFLLGSIILVAQLQQVNAMTEPYPISHYTDFKVISKSTNQIKLKVTNDFYNDTEIKNRLVNEFNLTENPYLYQSRLIAMPYDENVNITIKNIDSITIPVEEPVSIKENTNELPIAFWGPVGIMRDLKVAPLVIRQYQYNKDAKNIICYKNIELELKISSQSQFSSNRTSISNTWAEFYQNTLLNPPSANGIFNTQTPQGYLMIVADAFFDSILPLAQWKNLKGYTVTVKKISEIGSGTNYTAIRNYIRHAYETFTPRLEYVLIVGTHSMISGFPVGLTPNVGDHLYSCVAGEDLYPDLFIGRLPALNVSELRVMIAKILGYERTPYITDTFWFRKGLTVGTQYSTGQPVWTALATCRWTRNLMLEHGYLKVDTCFDPPVTNGVGIIDTFVNRGVSFINGRGWGNSDGWHRPQFYKENVNALLNNGWKLPIITSFYCGTGNYANPNRCFGEVWLLVGSPSNPRGAVAFYGPTYLNTSTRFNNCQNYGVYWGIFKENINNCGPAMFRGKLEMLNNFPMPADTQYLRVHTCTYNLLGDPSLEMWTGAVPKPMVVNHPSQISVGGSYLTVSVTDNASQPLSNVLVSLYKKNEIKMSALTDNSGQATFNFITQTSDTLFITTTKHNYIPYLGNILVTTQSEYVGLYSFSGSVIAGQTANLNISLKNYGSSQPANNTQAILRTTDAQITITDSIKSYGNILPGQTASAGPFQFSIATNCTNNYRINFQLSITSASNNWQAGFSVTVQAPELKYLNHIVQDNGNQILEPGETSNLIIKISNYGLENINNVSGVLRCSNPWIIKIIDSLGYFGNISAGDSLQNNTDYFIVQAASGIGIGRKFNLQLELKNPNGYRRIKEFPITIGVITSNAPTGPDNYGYWAYDNTDLGYIECPTYNWVEIDPNFGGQGTLIPMTYNSIKVLNLPWTFRYYGRNYSRVSVCSKGYIAMDSSWIIDQYNWSIPSSFGPPAMIATFWDDFRPDTLGASGIYFYNDVVNQRFIIEWSRIRHIHGFRDPVIAELQTFQVILYNPVFYPTKTGDGPIIFQYHTVFNDDSLSSDCHNYATVGIEDFDHTDGIEYTFAGQYPVSAATVISGRAIKFTTNQPDTFTGITENSKPDPKLISGQISNLILETFPNPFRTKSEIRYSIPVNSQVLIDIFDISGKLVKNLFNHYQNAGSYSLEIGNWKSEIPRGVYFIVLTAENNQSIIMKTSKLIRY